RGERRDRRRQAMRDRRFRHSPALIALLAGGLSTFAPTAYSAGTHAGRAVEQGAQPATSVVVDVLGLHGLNDNSGIDPRISAAAKEALSKPPFSSYNSYKFLSDTPVT